MSKHIIITGTSRGIGFEMVKQLSKQGHHILALSRNEAPVKALKLKKNEPKIFIIIFPGFLIKICFGQ